MHCYLFILIFIIYPSLVFNFYFIFVFQTQAFSRDRSKNTVAMLVLRYFFRYASFLNLFLYDLLLQVIITCFRHFSAPYFAHLFGDLFNILDDFYCKITIMKDRHDSHEVSYQ